MRCGPRTIRKVKISKSFVADQRNSRVYGRCELDSHADTIVAGQNCVMLHLTERVCEVLPYSDEYAARKDVPVCSAATGYTDAHGRDYILVFNEVLWMPDLPNTLLNPNQLRHYGIEVQDNPYDLRNPMKIKAPDDNVAIGLQSVGTTIFMNTWAPTNEDLQTCPHIQMSSDHPWDPSQVTFPGNDRQTISDMEVYNERRTVSMFQTEVMQQPPAQRDDADLPLPRRIFAVQEFRRALCGLDSLVASSESPGPLKESELKKPSTFISTERHSNTTPEDLSEAWQISLKQAQMTLKATTQHHVRSATMPLSRRYRTDRMFQVPRLRCKMSSDTYHARVDGIHGNKYAQVFGTKFMFCEAYPIAKKSLCHEALKKFLNEYGAPDEMLTDGAKEQCNPGTEWQKTLNKNNVPSRRTLPHRPNQNPAETVIRELRRKWYRTVFRTNCPVQLWEYGLPHIAKIMSLTATNANGLNGRPPLEVLTGETQDISEYLDFGFYDRVWFKETPGLAVQELGRFLGIAHRVGNIMSFWVLNPRGVIVSATTVTRVTHAESMEDANKQRFVQYDTTIAEKFKEGQLLVKGDKPDLSQYDDLLRNDPDFEAEFAAIISDDKVPEADDEFTPETYDSYVGAELAVDRGGEYPQMGKVTKRLRDANNNPIGRAHSHTALDSRMFEITFEDGHTTAMAANQIAENILSQVDQEGRRFRILDSIIDHRTDGSEISDDEAFLTNKYGNKCRRKTTKGWEILVQWKDGRTSWVALKDLKESNPVDLAEYALQAKIHEKPAFAWWVPYTLRKKIAIINKVKSKYWERTHKYGIRVPKSYIEACQLDAMNNNTYWRDAVAMEMKNVRPAFEVFEGAPNDLIGYTKIKCHMIYDVKLGENFRRKARLVAGGHVTNTPSHLTYSSVVSRDSVRICLPIAALNNLDVLSCDIQNAYLTAPCREKVYTIAGPEFGPEDKGKVMIIKQALYGLKSSGAAFHAKCASCLWDMQFRPSRADNDVSWMRPAVTPDSRKYYEYVLCYVDDIVAISHRPQVIMDGIKAVFKLKGDKVEEPTMYLGANLERVTNDKGRECWAMNSAKYVTEAVKNVENRLADHNVGLPTKAHNPFSSSSYHPAHDTTPELNAEDTTYFQELIGVLRWAVELGRVDILLEVALLSAHLAMPRQGHLLQVYNIFGYLKKYPKRKLYFDPSFPVITEDRFAKFDWHDFYRDAKEELPHNMPEPRGEAVSVYCFVDASHAADKSNRRSHTGILIFVNRAPVMWYSKRQNTVETSTYGSELTAMKTAMELIKGLRIKLRLFGIPVEGPCSVFTDNAAVWKNVSHPESTLNKKHHAISYHYCRECVASGMTRVSHESGESNLSDLFTKVLDHDRREDLLEKFMC